MSLVVDSVVNLCYLLHAGGADLPKVHKSVDGSVWYEGQERIRWPASWFPPAVPRNSQGTTPDCGKSQYYVWKKSLTQINFRENWPVVKQNRDRASGSTRFAFLNIQFILVAQSTISHRVQINRLPALSHCSSHLASERVVMNGAAYTLCGCIRPLFRKTRRPTRSPR